jgi:hypothetical protein
MKLGTLGLVAVFFAIGCSESRTATWEISAHRAPCVGEATSLCLIAREAGASEPSYHYDEIAGFAPQWGHEYTVDVRITSISNPPADGSSLEFTLLRVRRDEAVLPGTTFQFVVIALGPGYTPFLSLVGADAGELMDGTPFVCAAGSGACEAIAARLTAGVRFEITFAHGGGSLTALAVTDTR